MRTPQPKTYAVMQPIPGNSVPERKRAFSRVFHHRALAPPDSKTSSHRIAVHGLILCVTLVFVSLVNISLASPQPPANSALTSVPAKTWAKGAAEREIQIVEHAGSYIRYRQHTIDSRRDELRDVIESKDGTVARTIMRDNRPLTPEEDQAERDRLTAMLNNPSDFARHIRNEASSKKQAMDLIRIMPDAMIFTYSYDQTPAPESTSQQVVIDYTPDPHFNPPTTTSEALSGLRGRIWIDARAKTIVRMDGDIFQPINFGWGMLAHIYPGGKVDFEQAEAVGGRWNMTHFHEHVTLKALMVKTIRENSEVSSLDFQKLPGSLTYQDAIHLLLATPLPR